jgi:hypothetical protein
VLAHAARADDDSTAGLAAGRIFFFDVIGMRNPPIVVLASVLAACGGDGSRGPAATVTDSAGIEIVTNTGDISSLPVLRVDTVPLLSIGLVDGEAPYLLDGVRHATTLDDGRIAIVNVGTDEVRLFDAEGRYIRTFGRGGDGPGEYRFPGRVWQLADSIVVVDITSNRITVQPLDGSSPRTVPGVPDSRPSIASLFTDRSVILPIEERVFPSPGQSADMSMAYVRVPLDGSAPDTLLVLPNGKRATQQFETGGRVAYVTGPRLFEPLAFAAVLDGRLIGGSAAKPELVVIELDAGTTTRIIRWTGEGHQISDAHLQTYIEERVAESDEPDALRSRITGLEHPDSFPRFSVVLGGHGQLWVQQFRLPGETGPYRWRVHDGGGRLIAVAEVPAGLTLYEVGPDRVLALTTDDFDVQHVVVLPVREVR